MLRVPTVSGNRLRAVSRDACFWLGMVRDLSRIALLLGLIQGSIGCGRSSRDHQVATAGTGVMDGAGDASVGAGASGTNSGGSAVAGSGEGGTSGGGRAGSPLVAGGTSGARDAGGGAGDPGMGILV